MRSFVLSFILLVFSACAAAPSQDTPKDYLDPDTAATVDVVAQPMVFARDRREVAANSRDYVTLAAASVNRNGKIDYVLIAYFWSTLDARDKPSTLEVVDPLIVGADDRRIRLPLGGHSIREIGIGSPVHTPPGRVAQPNVYHTDLPTLRFLAEARHLAILTGSSATPGVYEIWDDRRQSLRELVKVLSGPRY